MAGSLFYANVTKGYKAGSFPTIGAATVSQYRPVVQESVIAYEAGFKQELFDRSVLLTGAGFYYDYRNKQLRASSISRLSAPCSHSTTCLSPPSRAVSWPSYGGRSMASTSVAR
ncbi:TonB-dependent receptor domain-containing protein [Rhizorhabdus histidinilytica]